MESYSYFKLDLKPKISLSKSSVSLFLCYALKKHKNLAYICEDSYSLKRLRDEIERIDPTVKVVIFPEFDCPLLSNLSPTKTIIKERILCFYNLIYNKSKTIFLASIKSLLLKVIPKQRLEKKRLKISLNKINSFERINNYLSTQMYERVEFVRNPGEYAVRGDIIDIYSPNEKHPLRILFDFDEIESLYLYDKNTQKSKTKIDEYYLFPATEIIFDDDAIRNFRENYRKYKFSNKEEYYNSISNKILLPGSDQFYPIIYDKYDSILEYLCNYFFFFPSDFENILKKKNKSLEDDISEINSLFLKQNNFISNKSEIDKILKRNQIHYLYNYFLNDKSFQIFSEEDFISNDKNKNKIKFLRNIKKVNKQMIFCFESHSNRKQITNYFNNSNLKFEEINKIEISDLKSSDSKIKIFNLSIQSSFLLKINNSDVLFLSENDFFDKIIKRKTAKYKTNEDNLINEFSQLSVGDLVVHIDHGVGKFIGLRNNDINGFNQDFIELQYHNNDKLLIPIENLELISRYGSDDKNPNLDKLGLQNWQNRKAIIKNKIKDIAKELVRTAAERKLIKADKIFPNKFEYEKFSSLFEFTETSDQIKAIEQIENDFISGNPMDRLICGDVGFGKTEIAMRAAFIAASAGYQVAMICPKVLLVNQHFSTFRKRFSSFNYQISKISRLESSADKEEIKKKLSYGLTNIIIGSHALLSEKIEFKKLGLIIIDEEQSFGVQQKEKLKKLKPNCHILTLSATPIPRTLQSSFLKIRQISLIKTPPVNRINIKTFLMLYDDNFLKKIIEFELKRNGQIYFVTPRINDQFLIKKKLIKIFPKLKFSIINGKLNANDIEQIYSDFFEKKIDLLISTAMIESGLDNSNVNTIIIDKPYLFGLSQLYQLRGRVGRSSVQAYAYLMLEKNINLNEDRMTRLKIISKIEKLGSGFSIAARDLDMRGGGNIIGSEQSGHIREVGVELYYKMINETINEIKNLDISETDWSPTIKLGFSFNIPDNYVSNLETRMSIYRNISQITKNSELTDMIDDLIDRYGKLPESFNNLFKIIEIKILSKSNNIKKIDESINGYVIEFREGKIDYADKLISLSNSNPEKIRLLPKSKIMYVTISKEKIKKIIELKDFLNLISRFQNESQSEIR